ncbi:MAG: C25 family cysteine peptidase, partial [Anaerolineae bacterium]
MKARLGLTGVLALTLSLGLAVGMGLAQWPEPPRREVGLEGVRGTAATMSSRIPIQRQLADQPPVEHKDVSPKSDSYDLLIITPAEFGPVLDPLVDHKNATGISAVMITLEDIYGDPALWGVDEPEQIKRAIEHYEQNHDVKYVMLAGDVDKFPVRWVAFYRGEDVDYYFPSDLYYADLYDSEGAFDTWNSDGDGRFGEHVSSRRCSEDPYNVNLDRADLHPDVAVGRVPASTEDELESYVAKVIKYEHLTSGSDWFYNVLLMAGLGRACDPGVHFEEIQRRIGLHFGDDFQFRTYIEDSYLTSDPDDWANFCRPCFCDGTETTDECLARTGLHSESQTDVFTDAVSAGTTWQQASGGTPIPVVEFEDVGFLGWHDHGSGIRDYSQDVNNADRFTVAFADGCNDGGFAGRPPGDEIRFASDRDNLPYITSDGHTLHVVFDDSWVDHDGDGVASKFYHITDCVFEGTSYSL